MPRKRPATVTVRGVQGTVLGVGPDGLVTVQLPGTIIIVDAAVVEVSRVGMGVAAGL